MTELPFNHDAEGAIVARLLLDPSQLPLLVGRLRPEDFHDATWRSAYAEMQHLAADRQAIDLVTLRSALGDREGALTQAVRDVGPVSRAPLEDYVGIVRRAAFRRRFIARIESVLARAYAEDNPQRALADLSDALHDAAQGVEDGRLVSPGQAIDIYRAEMERRLSGVSKGLHYGYDSLNDLLNPAEGGDLIILAARPSVGKTALAEVIADIWSQQSQHPVLFVSLEMSVSKLLDRTMARYTGIPAQNIIRGALTESDQDLVDKASTDHRAAKLWYLDDPFATTAAVRAAAARLKVLAGGIGAIVVDYLGLLKDQGDMEVQRVTRISRTLKAVALEMDCPVLALSQLNRAVELREVKKPRLSDLRESGAIEQDADVVIFLWRELTERVINFGVAKQRQGQIGDTTLLFETAYQRFAENWQQALV